MRVLLIDNYDSFTYNLVHLLEPLVDCVDVVLNDQFDIRQVGDYDAVVFSPGPGLPADAGLMPDVIDQYHATLPMLGICLGMQAMAEYFGGTLLNLKTVLHGISQPCHIQSPNDILYRGLPNVIETGHYHSWVVSNLPNSLEITAIHPDGWPASIQHRQHKLSGVQYHPESVLTPFGKTIVANWVNSL